MGEKEPLDVNVINHFYVSGVGVNRANNPNLNEYKMITRKKNWIEYVPKTSDERKMDSETLDILNHVKKYY
jgi:hypothetical protein